MRYAERVRTIRRRRSSYDQKEENEAHFSAAPTTVEEFGRSPGTQDRARPLRLAFLVMVYGVIPWEDLGIGLPTLWWWFPEMTASFLFFAIIIGVVGEMYEGESDRRSSTGRAISSGWR